jgi:hypothetical protein
MLTTSAKTSRQKEAGWLAAFKYKEARDMLGEFVQYTRTYTSYSRYTFHLFTFHFSQRSNVLKGEKLEKLPCVCRAWEEV